MSENNNSIRSKIETENADFDDTQIPIIVETAEKRAFNYEKAIKKGHFDIECPYADIIKVYTNIRSYYYQRNFQEKTAFYHSKIKHYRKKLEQDNKLREIEAKKEEKEKRFENYKKQDELDSLEMILAHLDSEEKLIDIEDQKRLEKEKIRKTIDMIDHAEKIAQDYQKEVKNGNILDYNCPYDSIIEIYRHAKEELNEFGWKRQAWELNNSIRHYETELHRDQKLREIEKKKNNKALV